MKNLIFAVLLAILAWSPAAAADLDATLIWKAKQICNDFGYQKANENYAECVRDEYNSCFVMTGVIPMIGNQRPG